MNARLASKQKIGMNQCMNRTVEELPLTCPVWIRRWSSVRVHLEKIIFKNKSYFQLSENEKSFILR